MLVPIDLLAGPLKVPMRTSTAGIALLLFTLLLLSCTGNKSDGEERFIDGMRLSELGRWTEAIAEFDAAISLDPEYAVAYSNRGRAFNKAGQPLRGLQDHIEAIKLRPDVSTFWYNRGNAYFDLAQYQRAIDDYDEAIRLNPEEGPAYISRAAAYNRLGRRDEAQDDLEKAGELEDAPE